MIEYWPVCDTKKKTVRKNKGIGAEDCGYRCSPVAGLLSLDPC